MAFEMICGQCRGNLLVEQFGVVVACPHCGAHLSIPAPEGTAPQPPAPEPAPVVPERPPVVAESPLPIVSESTAPEVVATSPVVDEQLPFFGQPAIEQPEQAVISETAPAPSDPVALFGTSEEVPTASVEPMVPESSTLEPIAPVAAEVTQTVVDADPPAVNMSASGIGLSALIGGTSVVTESVTRDLSETGGEAIGSSASDPRQSVSDMAATKAAAQAVDADHVLMSKTSVLLLLSYTSAVTIGFLYLFFHLMGRKEDNYGLESLPDLVPKKKNVSILLVPERAEMPDGHELKIGETQTFGNIKVTVTKVTRGPIQFVHHSRKSDEVRLPSSPVLKLWLKFENVSKDQEIPPLDSQLLFSRSGKTRFDWRANQFVCREEDKANTDKRKVYVYDHNFQSPWNLSNLPLDKPLLPKESREYYVPSSENDLDLLTGPLLWRVHFRKGYGPKGRGVTTIFEVHFESKDIQDEHV